tara:strand:+ start:107 stop:553 length:447 start_codon:yes stop_codon:yes gene_type:complete
MKKSIQKIIDWTLREMSMYSPEASEMVYKTGLAETGYRHLEQIKGPAIGFFQVEPATMRDTWDNYIIYRQDLKSKLWGLGYDEESDVDRVMGSIILQVVFCRLKYRRSPKALPECGDLEGQAKYWKSIYNSELGKGTVEHFMEACNGG